ncbi:MAG: ATP-grasp domain-containing protein [Phyllobacteriaceae bacterium]|nr:ATP-grasp domain-containing protein [Phyllobacteriaceae bacterium]
MKAKAAHALKPGDTIGIIGGGQLGRMLAMAAARLGLKTVILEPGADCPAAQTANRHIAAAYDDSSALDEFSAACDVITYEFENIPVSAVSFLEENNMLFPSSLALEKSQDRLTEKNFLRDLCIATAPFAPVDDLVSLEAAIGEIGIPSILKTRRLGYDGKGQVRIDEGTNLEEAWQTVGAVPAILEGFVDFSREISVIAARDGDGGVVCFDPAENVHREGILRTSTVPAVISAQTAAEAVKAAETITAALEYTGVIGDRVLRSAGRRAHRQRDRPQSAQFRPLDGGCVRRLTIRATYPRRCRLAAGPSPAPFKLPDGESHRR